VQALMQRCGFAAKGLFVMDGSKRSAHANAYFTGLGAAKRVVFFDTLLQRLSPGEVEAVLAHELGHFKHRTCSSACWRSSALSLAGLALLGWLAGSRLLHRPGRAAQPGARPTTRWRCCCSCWRCRPSPSSSRRWLAQLSRRHEFEADAYACAQAERRDLANALLKLHEDNAATLTPDPVYVRFYYYPPAAERLAPAGMNLAPSCRPLATRAERAEVDAPPGQAPGWALVDGAIRSASFATTTAPWPS
jgi:STE24 endopeptidase